MKKKPSVIMERNEWKALAGLADPYTIASIEAGVPRVSKEGSDDVNESVGAIGRGLGRVARGVGGAAGEVTGATAGAAKVGRDTFKQRMARDKDQEKDDTRDPSSDGEDPSRTDSGTKDDTQKDRAKDRGTGEGERKSGGPDVPSPSSDRSYSDRETDRSDDKRISPFLRLARGLGRTVGGVTGLHTIKRDQKREEFSAWEEFLAENGITPHEYSDFVENAIETENDDDIDFALNVEGLFSAWRKRKDDKLKAKQADLADKWKQARQVRDKYGVDATRTASRRGHQVGQEPKQKRGTSVHEAATSRGQDIHQPSFSNGYRDRVPVVRTDPGQRGLGGRKNWPGKHEARTKDQQDRGLSAMVARDTVVPDRSPPSDTAGKRRRRLRSMMQGSPFGKDKLADKDAKRVIHRKKDPKEYTRSQLGKHKQMDREMAKTRPWMKGESSDLSLTHEIRMALESDK